MRPYGDSPATVSPEPQWADIVTEAVSPPARSTGIFASKNEIVVAVCEQGTEAFRRRSPSKPSRTSGACPGFGRVTRACSASRPDLRRSGTFPGAGGRVVGTAAHRDAESTRRLDSSPGIRPERMPGPDRRGLCEHIASVIATTRRARRPRSSALRQSVDGDHSGSPISGLGSTASISDRPASVGQIPTYLASVPTIATACTPAEIRRVIALFHFADVL